MKNWIEQIRQNKRLRSVIFILLLGLVYFLPQPYVLTDIAYVLILFLIVYISSYIHTVPAWKGLVYSLIGTIIVIVVFLSIITLFPNIPFLLVLVIVTLTAGLYRYLIS